MEVLTDHINVVIGSLSEKERFVSASKEYPMIDVTAAVESKTIQFVDIAEPLTRDICLVLEGDSREMLDIANGALVTTKQQVFEFLNSQSRESRSFESNRAFVFFYVVYVYEIMDANEVFEDVWTTISRFFVDDPVRDGDYFMVSVIRSFWVKLVDKCPDLRGKLLRKIREFVEETCFPSFYNFFGVVIRISMCEDSLELLKESGIIKMLFGIASSDLIVTLFVRDFMCSGRQRVFHDDSICGYFVTFAYDAFFSQSRRSMVMKCLQFGFGNLHGSETAKAMRSRELMVSLGARIVGTATTEDREHVVAVFGLLAASLQDVSEVLLSTLIEEYHVLEDILNVVVGCPAALCQLFEIITYLCMNNQVVAHYMRTSSKSFFAVVGRAKQIAEPNVLEGLKRLATEESRSDKTKPGLIRIPRAIIACLKLFQSSTEHEVEIVSWISWLLDNSSNVFEMFHVKLPFLILSRLRVVQDNDRLRVLYTRVNETLADKMFSVDLFRATMNLLNDTTYRYPSEILNSFSHLLTLPDMNEPNVFFHFDRVQGSGFHSLELVLPLTFTVVTSVRLLAPTDSCFRTFIAFEFQDDYFSVGFAADKLYIRTIVGKDEPVQKEVSSKHTFIPGVWHRVSLTFNTTAMMSRILKVSLGGAVVATCKCRLKQRLKHPGIIHVASPGPRTQSMSLQADIEPIYCLKGAEIGSLLTQDTLRRIPESFRPSVICQFHPSFARGTKIYDICRTCPFIPFVGIAVSCVPSIRCLLPTVDVVKNVLPLFQRLVQSSGDPLDSASPAGSVVMSKDDGSRLVVALLMLMAQIARVTKERFTSPKHFAVLAELLSEIPPVYMSMTRVFEAILRLFANITCQDDCEEFAHNILLNFSVTRNWTAAAKIEFYRKTVPSAINLCPSAFKFPVTQALLGAMTNDDSPAVAKAIDLLLSSCIRGYPYQEDVDALFVLAVATEHAAHRTRYLQLLMEFIVNHPDMLAKFDYFEPFLLLVNGVAQMDVLTCMEGLMMTHPMKNAFVYKLAAVLTPRGPAELSHMFDFWFVRPKMSRFIPIICEICSREKIDDKFTKEIGKCIGYLRTGVDVPYWAHWVWKLAIIWNDGSISSRILEMVMAPIVNAGEKASEMVNELLMYVSLWESQQGIDLKAIRLHILMLLDPGTSVDTVLRYSFDEVIYHLEYTKTEECVGVPAKILSAFGAMNRMVIVRRNFMDWSNTDLSLPCLMIEGLLDVNGELQVAPNVKDHGLVIAAFLIARCLSHVSNVFDSYVTALRAKIDRCSADVQARCLSILEEVGDRSELDPQTMESGQSKCAQCHTEKTSWIGQLMETYDNATAQALFDAYQVDFCTHFQDVINFDKCNQETFLDNEYEAVFHRDLRVLAKEQHELYEITEATRRKTRDLFIREHRSASGVWSGHTNDVKFRLCNRISRTGRRVLMMPNHRFTKHEEASAKRNKGSVPELKTDALLNYKRVRDGPRSDVGSLLCNQAQNISIMSQHTGNFYVTRTAMLFTCRDKIIQMPFATTRFILNRRLMNAEVAIEVYMLSGASHMFGFPAGVRTTLYNHLAKLKLARTETSLAGKFNFFAELQNCCDGIHQNMPSERLVKGIRLCKRWKRRQISTYEYIYYLNILGGRSFNDSSQYPIYPWLIMDVTNESIDLNDKCIYRELGRPIPAYCDHIRERALHQWDNLDPESQCLWREIVSSSVGVFRFLVRVEPFATLHILVQSGQFDCADRQIASITTLIKDSERGAGNYREAVPEYYSTPQAFANENGFDLGRKTTGIPVNDIEVPPWADSAMHFISVCRRGFESDVVGAEIGKWIDLIFGVGRRSFEHLNVYPVWAYPELKVAGDHQTELFGCLPSALFTAEHPVRDSINIKPPLWTGLNERVRSNIVRLSDFSRIVSLKKGMIICESSIYDANDASCKRHNFSANGLGTLLCVSRALRLAVFGMVNDGLLTIVDIDTGKLRTLDIQNSQVTCACTAGSEYLIVGSSDALTYIYQLPALNCINVSANQSGCIVAIAANADLGLVASVNDRSEMVIETMFDGRFINAVNCVCDQGAVGIAIFKSGTIAVMLRHRLAFYDSRGIEWTHVPLTQDRGPVISDVSIDKYYDNGRELLLAITGTSTITIYDVATGASVAHLSSVCMEFSHICTITKGRTLLAVSRSCDRVHVFSLAPFLGTRIEKQKRLEMTARRSQERATTDYTPHRALYAGGPVSTSFSMYNIYQV